MLTQAEKGHAFAELHKRAGTFIIPNPWDIGSARLLTHLGFEALATSSAGYAFSIGKPDNAVGRDAMLAHAGIRRRCNRSACQHRSGEWFRRYA